MLCVPLLVIKVMQSLRVQRHVHYVFLVLEEAQQAILAGVLFLITLVIVLTPYAMSIWGDRLFSFKNA